MYGKPEFDGENSQVQGRRTDESDSKSGDVILKVAQKGKDLRKTRWRWFMLAMACGFLMGSYFCYDNPGPIKTQLERDFGWSDSKWSLLYTVYSIPNMVLPIVGGVFLDKIGMRVGLILFTVLLTVG